MTLTAPHPLDSHHQLQDFDCGESTLNDWLKRRALSNQLSGASRTFVVSNPSTQVLGYYALAAGAVCHKLATHPTRRNMLDPIPVLILARLAVDKRMQGMQLGAALLQDAVKRALKVADDTGVRALLVHALDEPAKQFYLHYGFQPSPIQPMTLMLCLPSLPKRVAELP